MAGNGMGKSGLTLLCVLALLCFAGCACEAGTGPEAQPVVIYTIGQDGEGADTSGISQDPLQTVLDDAAENAENAAVPPGAEAPVKEPDSSEFVRVRDYIPDIEVELLYATDRNFTGQAIYPFTDAWLRYGTVRKLSCAQDVFRGNGYRLKIWDAFRPVSAQFRLWEICPDSRYVANPGKGFSAHSRGNAVDVTLVDAEGNELAMPTGFDHFSRLADRDYSDVKDAAAVANVKMLEDTMEACGFKPYSREWWHFTDTESYEADETFEPAAHGSAAG